jgi:pantoate--beta-alanine ligase
MWALDEDRKERFMRIIERVSEMQQQAEAWRQAGRRIVLVPTMGYLHEGHLDLMRKGRKLGDVLAISIFVNPTQFGPSEDFARYPRDTERDIRLSEGVGVDVVFMPKAEEIYPQGYQTYVEVTWVTLPLCGRSRPGHFRGVATVVAKLFNIMKPHAAVFGEKDFQQLVTIRRMVQDLNMDIEIVPHPIVREIDGLAMSSRNKYLSSEQRQTALHLSRSLENARNMVREGERNGDAILRRVREILESDGDVRVDYVQLCRPDTLEEIDRIDAPSLLALAVYVGVTRLIDNCVLDPTA